MKLSEVTDEEPMVLTMLQTLLRKGEDVRMSFKTDVDEVSIYPIKSIEFDRKPKGPIVRLQLFELGTGLTRTSIPFGAADREWNIKKKDGYFLFYHENHPV